MTSYYEETLKTVRGLWSARWVSPTSGPRQEHNSVGTPGAGPSTLQPVKVNRHKQRAQLSALFDDSHAVKEIRNIEPQRELSASSKNTDSLNNSNGEDETILFRAGTARDPYEPANTAELPLLVACPCNLSDRQADSALPRLSQKLDSLGQEPYLLILFASPSPSIPVANLVRYYRGLSKTTRRNVQRLWICHPGFFSRMSVNLFLNAIVSGKVTRKGKVKLVDSLSQLAELVDITQLDIPLEVYMYNSHIEKGITLPASIARPPVFGMSLTESMTGRQLPRVVSDSLQELRRNGNLATPGIFRKAPKHSALQHLREAYDRGHPIDISQWPDSANLSASLLKLYLRSLPTSIIPLCMYAHIQQYPQDPDQLVISIQSHLLPSLSRDHPDGDYAAILLREILKLLHETAQMRDSNKMNSHNLAIVIAPVLVCSSDVKLDAEMCALPDAGQRSGLPWEPKQKVPLDRTTAGMVIKVAIERYREIFKEDLPDLADATAGSLNSTVA